MKKIKGFKKKKGFTLVELIAVIVVIVILAAIALPRIGDMQSAAGDAQSKASQATLTEAVERAIVEGQLSSGNFSSVTSVLTQNSPVTLVPYALSSDLNGASITVGTYPAFTVTVARQTYATAK